VVSVRSLQLNIIAIAAAVLGVFSLTIPVISNTYSHIDPRMIIFNDEPDLMRFLDGYGEVKLVFAPVAFLVGVILSFFTPLGGVPMALGIIDFYVRMHGHLDTHVTEYFTVTSDWGPGFYVGIGAASLAIASILLPIYLELSADNVVVSLQRELTPRRLCVWRLVASKN